ncbi:MAG: hypothetical protein ACP5E9_10185 [Candidatus Methanospirareceae archaeon]
MDTIGSATSKNNVRIRLTYKRWAHIIDSHDYMSGNMDLVFETLEDPDFIVHGWTDELIALKHYEKTSISEKYVVVVYKEGVNGFVITAFMTAKHTSLMKRVILWQK